jgi:PAS domain S-box-containing protein
LSKQKTNILIVGAGKGGSLLIDLFSESSTVHIIGVVDVNPHAPGIKIAQEKGIPTATDYKKFLKRKKIHEIINVTGSETVQEQLHKLKPSHVEVIGGYSAKLLWELIEERKNMEGAVRESEKAYRSLADNALVGIYKTTLEGEILYVNEALLRMLEFDSIEEIRSFNALTTYNNALDRESLTNQLQQTGKIRDFETSLNTKTGKSQFVIINATLEENIISGMMMNITERKNTEKALKRSEDEKAIILNSLAELVVYQDTNQKVIWVNRAAGESVNALPHELVGRYCYEIWHGRTKPCHNCPVHRSFKSGKFEHNEITSPDKRHWYVWAYPVKDSNGQTIGAVETVLNITDSKLAEEELRESEKRFRLLTEAAFDGIALSENGIFFEVNKAFAAIFRYTPEEMVGMNLSSVVAPAYLNDVMKKISSGYDKPYESVCINKEGNLFPVEVCGKSIPYKERTIRLTAIRDISERKRFEYELLKSEKLDSIGMLAGGIAHDFNNILTAVLGYISLSKMDTEPGSELFNQLDNAERATFRAKDLTQQLLTFSKGGVPIKTLTSIKEIIKDSASFALRGSKVKCELKLADDLWVIEADEGQISQAVNNLTMNAQQAMPSGGIMRITAENVLVHKKDNLPLQEGRYLNITISDQGHGIPKELFPKIFDPYFTTKQKGSGLGLAVVYSIIKNHGGYINVGSELGAGTTFTIYLPASPQYIQKKKILADKIFTGKGRILVMDDNKMVRDVLGDILKYLGYDVVFSKDGAEAIEMYRKALETEQPFDVVILDLTVPGGKGGKEALQELLTIDPKVKAMVSSGYSTDPVMAHYEEYGFIDVITKPYKSTEVGKKIHRILENKNTSLF